MMGDVTVEVVILAPSFTSVSYLDLLLSWVVKVVPGRVSSLFSCVQSRRRPALLQLSVSPPKAVKSLTPRQSGSNDMHGIQGRQVVSAPVGFRLSDCPFKNQIPASEFKEKKSAYWRIYTLAAISMCKFRILTPPSVRNILSVQSLRFFLTLH